MEMRTRVDPETLRRKLAIPNADRIFHLAQALQDGMSIDEIFDLTKIDRWFLQNLRQIVEEQGRLAADRAASRQEARLFRSAAAHVARGVSEWEIRAAAKSRGVIPTYRLVDTCAAEFEAYTPYYYSTYGTENEIRAGTTSAKS